MKNFTVLVVLILLVASISSCGGRRDKCPSVGKVNIIQHTVVV